MSQKLILSLLVNYLLGHSNDKIYNGEGHEHDFKVLVIQKGHKKVEQCFRLRQNDLRFIIDRILDQYVDFVDSLRAHLPIVPHICHFLLLTFRYDLLIGKFCFFSFFFFLRGRIRIFLQSRLLRTAISTKRRYVLILLDFCTQAFWVFCWLILGRVLVFTRWTTPYILTWRTLSILVWHLWVFLEMMGRKFWVLLIFWTFLSIVLSLKIVVICGRIWICWLWWRGRHEIDITHRGKHVLLGQRWIILFFIALEFGRLLLGVVYFLIWIVNNDQRARFFYFGALFSFWRLFTIFTAKITQIFLIWLLIFLHLILWCRNECQICLDATFRLISILDVALWGLNIQTSL